MGAAMPNFGIRAYRVTVGDALSQCHVVIEASLLLMNGPDLQKGGLRHLPHEIGKKNLNANDVYAIFIHVKIRYHIYKNHHFQISEYIYAMILDVLRFFSLSLYLFIYFLQFLQISQDKTL